MCSNVANFFSSDHSDRTPPQGAIYRYVQSRNHPMDPALPIPDAPPTGPTRPHPACPHPSSPGLHQPAPASNSWHHPASQIQPSIPTLPILPTLPTLQGPPCPPCPLLPLGHGPAWPGPALPALPCPPLQHQPCLILRYCLLHR